MRQAPLPFLRARLAALFLLSLAAVYGMGLSLAPVTMRRPLQMIWPPLALGAATYAGAAILDRLYSLVDRSGRGRIQLVGWILYGALLFLVTMGLFSGESGRDAVRTGAQLMRFAQPAFLLFAGMGRSYLGAILNAFAMTCLAALGGGPAAALAVAAHAGLMSFFLVADHHARLLSDYPVDEAPRAAPVLMRALLASLAMAAALLLFFWIVPCEPYAPLMTRSGAGATVPPEQAWRLIRDLVAIAVLAGLAFWLILWLGGGRSREVDTAAPRKVAARRETVPGAAPAAASVRPDPQDWRAKIVRIYVRLAEQLSKLGVRRKPCDTPMEFARSLAPEGAAASLTELFTRARYGDRDLAESDVQAASRAGAEILDHFRKPPRHQEH